MVRVVGTTLVVLTVVSILAIFFLPNSASWVVRLAVILLWCWHGWGVWNWAWTVAPHDAEAVADVGRDAGHPIYEPHLADNYAGWISAMIAGHYLLRSTGGLTSWLVAAGLYFGLAWSLKLALGIVRRRRTHPIC